MKPVAIILFLLMYVLLLSFPKIRAQVALSTAVIFVILGILPIDNVFSSIEWNVILMIAGTMGLVFLFIESKMPSLLADKIIEKTPNVKWAIVALALFAAIISAFVDNVATVLMVAPVAITIAKKLEISPVPSIIAISISSNLQGAATLVGDTTSILLGDYNGMDFLDFFWYDGRPGLFFVVQLSAIAATFILLYIFRKQKQGIEPMEKTVVQDYVPTVLLLGTVVLLIIASFIPNKPDITNGLICMTLFIIGLVRSFIIKRDAKVFKEAAKEIDYQTLLLLIGLFIVIAGIENMGVIADIGEFIAGLSDNPFIIYTILVWGSVLISAFIDNIPYVATMLPVVTIIALKLDLDPTVFYFGLLSGATLGGNLSPIGASANITGLGILRKEGYEVSAPTFMKISVPFTLTAVTVGYILIWILWGF
ncbi:MAG TPA: arsenic transporter [Acholeplasmataceae bacterium]|nr:arsenic transporter [Acholeplasmataceae bacterium]